MVLLGITFSMFSQDLADHLISLPKTINDGGANINLQDENSRLYLKSEDAPNYDFLVQIYSNKKKTFGISIHNQEDNSHIGLIRIDFNGGHKNPEKANEFVPNYVKKYEGHWFENESHMHLYIQGYSPLAWAIPLSDSNFPIKNISDNNEYESAIIAFMNIINNKTNIQFQHPIL